jgi:hypothetical protein
MRSAPKVCHERFRTTRMQQDHGIGSDPSIQP